MGIDNEVGERERKKTILSMNWFTSQMAPIIRAGPICRWKLHSGLLPLWQGPSTKAVIHCASGHLSRDHDASIAAGAKPALLWHAGVASQ